MALAVEPAVRGLFTDPRRAEACLRAIELAVSHHFTAATGQQAPQSMNYLHKARSKEEIEASGGAASGIGAIPAVPDQRRHTQTAAPAVVPVQSPPEGRPRAPWA